MKFLMLPVRTLCQQAQGTKTIDLALPLLSQCWPPTGYYHSYATCGVSSAPRMEEAFGEGSLSLQLQGREQEGSQTALLLTASAVVLKSEPPGALLSHTRLGLSFCGFLIQ
jgi:hypothetical protein